MNESICIKPRWVKSLFLFCVLLPLLLIVPSRSGFAHVGSSGVIVQKQAGKYQLLISINPPDVIPGTAKVTVFVEQGRVNDIGARPIYFLSGDKGAPTHDKLTRVGDNHYEGDVWLMASGSSSVELNLNGPDGRQQVIVPVMAIATALRDMPAGTGWGLAAMGLLLVVMLVTIIGASNADGVVIPGRSPQPTLRRRRLWGMGVGLGMLVLLLTGWRSWWMSTAEEYRNEQLYKPTPISTNVHVVNAQRQLTIQLKEPSLDADGKLRRQFSYLLPDHGKLMHTFLVRTPGLDAFAHIHPNRRDTLTYEATLPPLPGGRYLLYADIVYRNGFSETMTDTVDVPSLKISAEAATTAKPSDPDDSWLLVEPVGKKDNAARTPLLDDDMVVCGKPSASSKLADGSTMIWMDKPSQVLEAGKLYALKFAVADAQGKAAAIEPYLGMGGHAAIVRSDGSVYIHLHPVGTYSMAAERSLTGRLADTSITFHFPNATRFRDSVDTYLAKLKSLSEAERNQQLSAGMNHAMKTNNMVEFPYAFPRAGQYRLWIQVKRKGQVLTGVFDTQVSDPVF